MKIWSTSTEMRWSFLLKKLTPWCSEAESNRNCKQSVLGYNRSLRKTDNLKNGRFLFPIPIFEDLQLERSQIKEDL